MMKAEEAMRADQVSSTALSPCLEKKPIFDSAKFAVASNDLQMMV